MWRAFSELFAQEFESYDESLTCESSRRRDSEADSSERRKAFKSNLLPKTFRTN